MKKRLLLLLLSVKLIANDSEYYTSGNELVPLESANVRLDKEVLTIKHVEDFNFKVDVKYTLFNEGKERDTLVGFESVGQIGDAEPEMFFEKKYDDKKVLNAEQKAIKTATGDYENEYVSNFKVMVNGKKIAYKTADIEQIKKDKHTSPYVGSLYYFPVHLKKGVNTLHQTYNFDGDNSGLFYAYEFSYILETAKRWKGGKIKDFTLVLDMGDNEGFRVVETFFKGTKNWTIKDGRVKHIPAPYDKELMMNDMPSEQFYIYRGKAVFHQKNFVPNSSIFLRGTEFLLTLRAGLFDFKHDNLPFAYHYMPRMAIDKQSLKVLIAFPYARYGATFKDKVVNNYYKKCLWYKRDLKYKQSFSSLDKEGQEFIKNIEILKHKILKNLPYARRGYVFKDIDLRIFYETKKWYKEKSQYKANPSDMSASEEKWLEKVMAKKNIGDAEFFELIIEFEKLYMKEHR